MGSLGVTLCTAVLALTALTTPAVAADPGVSIRPQAPAPGGEVSLKLTGCPARTGTAASPAFVSEARLTGSEGTLTGETKVRSGAAPGSYDMTITCGDFRGKGSITVAAEPSAPSSPIAPVRAGGGGAADRLAAVDARTTGPGTAHTITGLLLAGAAALAVVLLPRALGFARSGKVSRARRSRGGR
ncbi:hypothetical protein [Streptomyces sp. enrichment culture]|uniref:hypothetical protein n=1 Tax=Streptomyces sp. enrichment culture TaxID=1795815 RepID=UPI003F5459D4